MGRIKRSPRSRVKSKLSYSPVKKTGKKSWCLISYVQDGIMEIKKLPPNAKRGEKMMSSYNGRKYESLILFVGDHSTCSSQKSKIEASTSEFVLDMRNHNPEKIDLHQLNAKYCKVPANVDTPIVTYPQSEYRNVCSVIEPDTNFVAEEATVSKVIAEPTEQPEETDLAPPGVDQCEMSQPHFDYAEETASDSISKPSEDPVLFDFSQSTIRSAIAGHNPIVGSASDDLAEEASDDAGPEETDLAPPGVDQCEMSQPHFDSAEETVNTKPSEDPVLFDFSQSTIRSAIAEHNPIVGSASDDLAKEASNDCVVPEETDLEPSSHPVLFDFGRIPLLNYDIPDVNSTCDVVRKETDHASPAARSQEKVELQINFEHPVILDSGDTIVQNSAELQHSGQLLQVVPGEDEQSEPQGTASVLEVENNEGLKSSLVVCKQMGEQGHLPFDIEVPVIPLSEGTIDFSAVYISHLIPESITEENAAAEQSASTSTPDVDSIYIYEHYDEEGIFRILTGKEAVELLNDNEVPIANIINGSIYSLDTWGIYGSLTGMTVTQAAVARYLYDQKVTDFEVFSAVERKKPSSGVVQAVPNQETIQVPKEVEEEEPPKESDSDYDAGTESGDSCSDSEVEEKKTPTPKKYRRTTKEPPAPLEGWSTFFMGCPKEFRKHVYEQKRDPYTYRGPLVVLPKAACDYVGKGAAQHFCLFCGRSFSALTKHLRNVHSAEERVIELEKLAEVDLKKAIKEYKILHFEGDYKRNNAAALSTNKGFLLTDKRSNDWRDAKGLIHCSACWCCIEKKNFKRHLPKCFAEGPLRTLLDEKTKQLDMLPSASKSTQVAYLKRILNKLRDPERKRLCLTDPNIFNFLLAESFKKLRGQTSCKNIRALANLICRFFVPLFDYLQVTSTSEVLRLEHADTIHDRLKDFGDLDEFYNDHHAFIEKLKNSERGRAVGQYARTMNPVLKALTAFAKHQAIKAHGFNSEEAGSHRALLEFMSFKRSWDNHIFFGLTLQRRMQALHVNPQDGLIDEEDNKKLKLYLAEYLNKLGKTYMSGLDMSDQSAILHYYNQLCDAVSSILIVYSVCRKTEVEGMSKALWHSGVQSEPLTKGANAKAVATLTRDVSTLGKGSLPVKVNIPKAYHSSIELILKLQSAAGVPATNPHIFAQAKTDKFRDSTYFFKKAAKACGARKPDNLSSQWQRRKFCTEADLMDRNAAETTNFDRRLCHTRGVAKLNYELNADKRLKEDVVPLNVANFHGIKMRGKRVKDVQIADILEKEPDALTGRIMSTSGEAPGSTSESEDPDDPDFPYFIESPVEQSSDEEDGQRKKAVKRKAPSVAPAKGKNKQAPPKKAPARKPAKKQQTAATSDGSGSEAEEQMDRHSDSEVQSPAPKRVKRKKKKKNAVSAKKRQTAATSDGSGSEAEEHMERHSESEQLQSPATKGRKSKRRRRRSKSKSPAKMNNREKTSENGGRGAGQGRGRGRGGGRGGGGPRGGKGGQRGPTGKWFRYP